MPVLSPDPFITLGAEHAVTRLAMTESTFDIVQVVTANLTRTLGEALAERLVEFGPCRVSSIRITQRESDLDLVTFGARLTILPESRADNETVAEFNRRCARVS